MYFFFFFSSRRRHTRLQGDWSSDVCSSDLLTSAAVYVAATFALTWPLGRRLGSDVPGDLGDPLFSAWVLAWDATHLGRGRSEERRVGKEGRSRWSPYH